MNFLDGIILFAFAIAFYFLGKTMGHREGSEMMLKAFETFMEEFDLFEEEEGSEENTDQSEVPHGSR